jgi:hypothetical protein
MQKIQVSNSMLSGLLILSVITHGMIHATDEQLVFLYESTLSVILLHIVGENFAVNFLVS